MAVDYTTTITIDLPRDKVVALFDDPGNLPKWQRGLQSFEPLSGQPGQVGAKSKLVFQMGKRRMEMIETITHLAFYGGWPNAVTAIAVAKEVFAAE